MATPTQNYQFAFNGWLFGGPGQGVQVLEVDGLEDLPTMRTQDDIRGYQDGMFTGRDFLNNRTITFTLQIMNDSSNSMQVYLQELKSNLLYQQQGTGVLQFMLPNRAVQRVSARVRRRALRVDPEYTYGKAIAQVELFCPDPRIYDDALQTQTLTPAAQLGRTYNRTYDLMYNNTAGSQSSVASFTNSGNVTVYPTFTLNGQMTTPIITNATTGQFLLLNIVTNTNDVIVVDTDLRSITYNGTPARNILDNTSNWFGLPPGNTTIGIVSPIVASGANCVVTFRNGYV